MGALTTILGTFMAGMMLCHPTPNSPNTRHVIRELAVPTIITTTPMLLEFPTQDKIGGILGLPLGTPIEQCPTDSWPPPRSSQDHGHSRMQYDFGTWISINDVDRVEVDANVYFVDGKLAGAHLYYPVSCSSPDKGWGMAMEVISALANSLSADLLRANSWDQETCLGHLELEDKDGNQLVLDWDGNQNWLMLVVRAGWAGDDVSQN